MEYGLQLYSIRDLTEVNYEEALKQVAQVGYKFVETCGFCGHTAQEVDVLMKKYGLEVLSIHTWWDQALPDPDSVIADCKVLNCKNAVIPAANLYTREGIEEFIRLANIVQPKFEAAGIRLGYHNHAQEFTICGEPGDLYVPFMEILNRTKLSIELDTYWAYVGGQDNIKLMERLGDRLMLIHIKDGNKEGDGTPLGMGNARPAEVYQKALEMNVPMIVESETCHPTGMAEAEFCHRFLVAQENK